MKNLKTMQKLFSILLMSILLFQCNTAKKEIEEHSILFTNVTAIDAKFGDVEPLDNVLRYLENLDKSN